MLPAGTAFGEAGETWEVLASAADSRMVVLIDDLRDVSVQSLTRLLGRRHPTLPILAVGEQTRPAGGEQTYGGWRGAVGGAGGANRPRNCAVVASRRASTLESRLFGREEPSPSQRREASLLAKSPRLRRILLAYTINELGTWFGYVALALGVYASTHSAICDRRPVSRARPAAGAAGACARRPHRALAARRTADAAVPAGGAADGRSRRAAMALLAARRTRARHDRRNRCRRRDGADPRLRSAGGGRGGARAGRDVEARRAGAGGDRRSRSATCERGAQLRLHGRAGARAGARRRPRAARRWTGRAAGGRVHVHGLRGAAAGVEHPRRRARRRLDSGATERDRSDTCGPCRRCAHCSPHRRLRSCSSPRSSRSRCSTRSRR